MSSTWMRHVLTLDKEIHTLEHQLVALKTQRNAFTPICRVPSELIEKILLIIQCEGDDDDPQRHCNVHWRSKNTKWVHVMLACRHIRLAALQSSSLWSFVDVNHKSSQWISICAERAVDHPLNIHCSMQHVQHRTDPARTEMLRHHIIRAGRLRLVVTPFHNIPTTYRETCKAPVEQIIQGYLNISLPALMSIEIVNPSPVWPRIGISGRFLDGNVNLRYLLLERCDYEHLPSMPHLEGLILRNFRVERRYHHLRSFLCRIPYLKKLVLHHPESASFHPYATRIQDLAMIETEGPVPLPHLLEFDLLGTADLIGQIHLMIPDPQYSLGIHARNMEGYNFGRNISGSHEQRITQGILARMLDYHTGRLDYITTPKQASYSLLLVFVGPENESNTVKVKLSPLIEENKDIFPIRSMALHMVSPIDEHYLIEVASRATIIHIAQAKRLPQLHILLVTCRHLRTLTIRNLDLNVNTRVFPHRSQDRSPDLRSMVQSDCLGCILSQLAAFRQRPLDLLSITYGKTYWFPSLSEQAAATGAWIQVQWVTEIQWNRMVD